jgi:hypothetical protein
MAEHDALISKIARLARAGDPRPIGFAFSFADAAERAQAEDIARKLGIELSPITRTLSVANASPDQLIALGDKIERAKGNRLNPWMVSDLLEKCSVRVVSLAPLEDSSVAHFLGAQGENVGGVGRRTRVSKKPARLDRRAIQSGIDAALDEIVKGKFQIAYRQSFAGPSTEERVPGFELSAAAMAAYEKGKKHGLTPLALGRTIEIKGRTLELVIVPAPVQDDQKTVHVFQAGQKAATGTLSFEAEGKGSISWSKRGG